MALVLAGIAVHQPEVRVDKALLGVEVPALDPPGQPDLLLPGQEAVAPHLVHEERRE